MRAILICRVSSRVPNFTKGLFVCYANIFRSTGAYRMRGGVGCACIVM